MIFPIASCIGVIIKIILHSNDRNSIRHFGLSISGRANIFRLSSSLFSVSYILQRN